MPESLVCDSCHLLVTATRAMSIQMRCASFWSILQTGNVPVPDERRPQFAVSVRFAVLNFKIENAHPVTRFALINTAVARANHHPIPSFLFASYVNHRVSD